jgi:hypothetical protein
MRMRRARARSPAFAKALPPLHKAPARQVGVAGEQEQDQELPDDRSVTAKCFARCVSINIETLKKGLIVKLLIMTAAVIVALPFMALGQKEEPQPQQPQQTQGQAQGQTSETQTTTTAPETATAPAAKSNAHSGKQEEQTKTETSTDVKAKTDVKGHAQDLNKAKGETRSERTTDERGQTDVKVHAREGNRMEAETRSGSTTSRTTVNVQEFRSRHSEVFSLGRHPREFFTQKFGEKHFRLIGNGYFVLVDGCWVAVDVDGFVYAEQVICAGDPEFIIVD